MNINALYLTMPLKAIQVLSILLLLSLSLTACDNKDNKGIVVKQKTLKYSSDTTLTGKVSNKKDKIISGTITARDSKGATIASTELNNSNKYSIIIPSGVELPVILAFQTDDNSTSKDKLLSVVIYTAIKKYDINELTTLIAKKAKQLGGYSHRNMSLAADTTVGVPDANKTSTGFRGDPTSQYGGWH